MNTDEPGPIDYAVLEDIVQEGLGGDRAMLAELIDVFLEDAATHLDGLRDAASRADVGTLREAAHALTGTTGNFGAVRMRAICIELEELGKNGSTAGAAELVDRLGEEFARASELLREEQQRTD